MPAFRNVFAMSLEVESAGRVGNNQNANEETTPAHANDLDRAFHRGGLGEAPWIEICETLYNHV